MSKPSKSEFGPEGLASVPSHSQGEVHIDTERAHDAVFGEITEDGPNYRNLGWLGTVALMMKTQIGLGVLSIPAAFDALGVVPDWIFVAGSAMLGISIGLNSVSTHATCTAVFVAVAAIVSFLLSSIRTLNHISWLAWLGVVSILIAVLMVTIAVGLQDRPAAAPQEGHWVSDFKITNNPSFPEASVALSSIVFAYAGTPSFFSIVAEMRDPTQFTRSLITCQTVVTIFYIVIGCVMYYYCGSYVASPALGSAGGNIKRISYGIALPGLMVTSVLVTHIAAKYMLVRLLRNSKHLTANTLTHWGTWLGCTFGISLISYIVASAIPAFSSLVSLLGALMGTFLTFHSMGCAWFFDNWSVSERTPRWYAMCVFAIFVLVSGTFLMISGTYGSILDIIKVYRSLGGYGAWTCVDNSGSV
ncbi:hypothetical protein CEP52_002555 [Fusarium oligoseptatum]|uniref:Amino acid transporter transmembrane domain-containing protein n=1 Tax=Fusarium oligoseptatum TaxID=2604345 RepID=A0A428UDG3_9HYPO|nr:hypothetical protein CEP52_002555 [Fusarium oligoseptatum]